MAAGRKVAGLRATLVLLLGLLALAARAQRPQLKLDLVATSTLLTDPTYVFVDADATTGYDPVIEAEHLTNSNGLNIFSVLSNGQQLTANGLPPSAFTVPYTVPLGVGIPQDDIYNLVVSQLTNFNFVNIYLVDAVLQTRLLLTQGSTYSFPLSGANTGGTYTTTRFSLVFEPNPLPVTPVAFTAERQGADGLLRWTTASEQHNAYFQVESSLDGTLFTALGQVAGLGTTAQRHSYQFRDANIARYAAEKIYYRLRQVDTDGSSHFSPVRPLAGAADFALEAFPTAVPAGQPLHILLRTPTGGPILLRITDALGKPVAQQVLDLPAGATTITLPEAGQWAAGLYLVRVQQGTQQQAAKILKL